MRVQVSSIHRRRGEWSQRIPSCHALPINRPPGRFSAPLRHGTCTEERERRIGSAARPSGDFGSPAHEWAPPSGHRPGALGQGSPRGHEPPRWWLTDGHCVGPPWSCPSGGLLGIGPQWTAADPGHRPPPPGGKPVAAGMQATYGFWRSAAMRNRNALSRMKPVASDWS